MVDLLFFLLIIQTDFFFFWRLRLIWFVWLFRRLEQNLIKIIKADFENIQIFVIFFLLQLSLNFELLKNFKKVPEIWPKYVQIKTYQINLKLFYKHCTVDRHHSKNHWFGLRGPQNWCIYKVSSFFWHIITFSKLWICKKRHFCSKSSLNDFDEVLLI